MDGYNSKSCNALEKPYYKPIEAALRWCNLINHEIEILRGTGNELFPGIGVFPQWPCLRANAEKIYDAILNGGLPHGRDGRTVSPGDHVAKERLTIRHADLREWMAKNYPDQKPPFLFDEVERNTHAAINADTFRALQADRDALNVRLEKAADTFRNMKQELDAIKGERDSLRAMVDKAMTTRQRRTLLTVIAAMCKHEGLDAQARGVAQRIMEMTDDLGAHVDDGTIQTMLKEIPDALEARMK
ncbi:MAG: protein kinase [Candidatus Accumulibacter sp.]|nr:protein kinase [Candidatus Accumulibacter necessarius]